MTCFRSLKVIDIYHGVTLACHDDLMDQPSPSPIQKHLYIAQSLPPLPFSLWLLLRLLETKFRQFHLAKPVSLVVIDLGMRGGCLGSRSIAPPSLTLPHSIIISLVYCVNSGPTIVNKRKRIGQDTLGEDNSPGRQNRGRQLNQAVRVYQAGSLKLSGVPTSHCAKV